MFYVYGSIDTCEFDNKGVYILKKGENVLIKIMKN